MADNKALIDGVQPTVTTAVNAYTSPSNGGGTRIASFAASLKTGSEIFSIFIGTAATVVNEIVPDKKIKGPAEDANLVTIDQFVPAGSSIFVKVSTGTTITFRASGIEF